MTRVEVLEVSRGGDYRMQQVTADTSNRRCRLYCYNSPPPKGCEGVRGKRENTAGYEQRQQTQGTRSGSGFRYDSRCIEEQSST